MSREEHELRVKQRWEYIKLIENNIPPTAPTDRLLILLPMYIEELKKQIEKVPLNEIIINDLLDKLHNARNRLTLCKKQINTSIIAY